MSSEATLRLPKGLLPPVDLAEVDCQDPENLRASVSIGQLERLSDEDLLIAAGRGSKDAIGVLFRRHGRSVQNVAFRILRDESEATDLRQEVFVYLFERAGLYDPNKASASSWIMQITYHRAIDRRRFLTLRNHYNVEELNEQKVGTLAAEGMINSLDSTAILERLRRQLSPDQQKTLELHFFEGYSLREIAEKRGQTLGNVRHHYYRALERLRAQLFSKKRTSGERIG